jgi:hypothetical protein
MNNVSNAMRRHSTDMTAAISLAKTELSEEERLQMGVRVTASLNEAQVAWDTYRQHLAEHGIGTEQS